MKRAFENQTVMITGASAGFGASMADCFAREGARLILIARRADRLEKLKKTLFEKYATEMLSLELDVTNANEVIRQLNSLPDEFSSIDILINNAGMVRGLNKVWETPLNDWNEMIDINIKGLLNVSAQVIPKMVQRKKGHIINMGSISSYDTYPGGGIYCATKFAVRALTDTLRKELVSSPIRVSMVSPGMAETEFSLVRFSGDQAKADAVYENLQPLEASDVAEVVLFIASRPPHVNIADVVVYPTHQASVSLVHREHPTSK